MIGLPPSSERTFQHAPPRPGDNSVVASGFVQAGLGTNGGDVSFEDVLDYLDSILELDVDVEVWGVDPDPSIMFSACDTLQRASTVNIEIPSDAVEAVSYLIGVKGRAEVLLWPDRFQSATMQLDGRGIRIVTRDGIVCVSRASRAWID
jgi:hypothetical protein